MEVDAQRQRHGVRRPMRGRLQWRRQVGYRHSRPGNEERENLPDPGRESVSGWSRHPPRWLPQKKTTSGEHPLVVWFDLVTQKPNS